MRERKGGEIEGGDRTGRGVEEGWRRERNGGGWGRREGREEIRREGHREEESRKENGREREE